MSSGSFCHDHPRDFVESQVIFFAFLMNLLKKIEIFQWQKSEKSLNFVIYRWIIAAFFVFSLAVSVEFNISQGYFHVFFIYMTHINLCGTVIMTTLSALLVTFHHFDIIKVETEMTKSLKLYWLLWNQSIVFAFIVDAAFWILLYKGEQLVLDDILIHVTNFLVLALDLIVVKHPPRRENFIHIVIVELGYMIFTVVYQFCGGLDK